MVRYTKELLQLEAQIAALKQSIAVEEARVGNSTLKASDRRRAAEAIGRGTSPSRNQSRCDSRQEVLVRRFCWDAGTEEVETQFNQSRFVWISVLRQSQYSLRQL